MSVERAVLRLSGLEGADVEGIPWVNRLVDVVRDDAGLEHGVALPVWDAMLRTGDDLLTVAQKAAAGSRDLPGARGQGRDESGARGPRASVAAGIRRIDASRAARDKLIGRYGNPPAPWIYLIVATGDIYEDMPQAQAAAARGRRRHRGDPLHRAVAARLRARGRDHARATAGTYATQENFRLMRAALDETSKELGRYVRLTNYASGLCMPEIADAGRARAARHDAQRLDVRDPVPRHQPDPHVRRPAVRRQIHARAGIIINTGEDNYLTTADAVDAAHTVTVSQLLNEFFAKEAGLEDWQLGLGHAFEINPDIPDSFRLELAQAHARPRAVPGRAAQVDAADEAHDRRRLPRLPARRLLQPGRSAHRPGHPARRHDDRGGRDPVAVRPRPRAAERSVRVQRCGQPARGLPAARRTGSSPSARARCSARPSTCSTASSTTRCSTRSPTARSV